jgi:hypothetical protein
MERNQSVCKPVSAFDMGGVLMLGFTTFNAMTQVLQHDYGKSKVTLFQIRAAIKAVKAERSEPSPSGVKRKAVAARKVGSVSSTKSRKSA